MVTEDADSSIKLFSPVLIFNDSACKIILIIQISWLLPAELIFFALIDEEGVDYWWWDCWSNACLVP